MCRRKITLPSSGSENKLNWEREVSDGKPSSKQNGNWVGGGEQDRERERERERGIWSVFKLKQ
jgi:hypothetical protein